MKIKQIWHPWTEWECYAAGMFDGKTKLSPENAKEEYRQFLSDIPRFKSAMDRVIDEWPISCEHFLTNEKINRVAWLGQASMCIATGINRRHRAGFKLLTAPQQTAANKAAQETLDRWIRTHESQSMSKHGLSEAIPTTYRMKYQMRLWS